MVGWRKKGFAPHCGEPYWRKVDTHAFEETKLLSCQCDRIRKYCEEFLRQKGLNDEFEKFMRDKEKAHWRKKIIETFQYSDSIHTILHKLKKVSTPIRIYLTEDEVLEAVSKGLSWLDNASEDLERVVEGIAKIFGINPSKAHRMVLASAL